MKSQQLSVTQKSSYLSYGSASAIGIAGILHLVLFFNGLKFGINAFTVFFLVSAILQLFWIIPMLRQWGKTWYYIGIGGTVILIALWGVTRVPNPITHQGMPIDNTSIVAELFQVAFIVMTAIILTIPNGRGKSNVLNRTYGRNTT